MRKIKQLVASFGLAMVLAAGGFTPVLAAAPYLADQVLGQTTSGSPDFTATNENDRPYPNADGFNTPEGVAIDPTHHLLFISDTSYARVLVFNLNSSNVLLDRTADYVLGQTDFSSSGSGTTQSTMFIPRQLAVDTANSRLFVADWYNNRVLVFTYSSLSNGMNASAVLGQATYTASTAATTQAGMNHPDSLAYDSSTNRLYVGEDNNGRVMVYDVAGITNGENAINVLGKANYTTSGSSPITASGLFGYPKGLAVDEAGQRLFVSDSGANRVLVFDVASITNGEAAVHVLGVGNFTTQGPQTLGQAAMYSPSGLAYDPSTSYLYAGSSEHRRVMIFDTTSITDGENAVHVLGSSDFSSVPNIIDYTQASTQSPAQLALGGGRLYVTQTTFTHRLTVFDTASITDGENAVDILGQTNSDGSPNYTSNKTDNARPNANGLDLPDQMAIDDIHHRLFVGDYNNNRVLVHQLDSNNNLIDDIPDAVLGQPGLTTSTMAVGQAQMDGPSGVAYDPSRNWLYVADANNYRILVFDVAAITNGENAINVLGQPDFTTADTAVDQNSLDGPEHLAFDASRDLLFVTDFTRVMVFDTTSITDGENAVYVLGRPNFTDFGATAVAANTFSFPEYIVFDAAKKWLAVTDGSRNRVLIFDTASIANGMDASYVLGAPNFTTDGDGGPSQTGIGWPQGMAVDEDHQQLFIKDNNQRIMIFNLNGITNNAAAVGLIGATDYANWNEFGVGPEYVDDSGDLVYNNAGNALFSSDYLINRIVAYHFVRLSDSVLTSATTSQAYSFSLHTAGDQGTLSFTKDSGTLPAGVSLSSAGVLSGTPTQSGNFTFTVTVNDDNGVAGTFTDTKTFVLAVVSNDIDNDGTPNSTDTDDDGDAIPDTVEDAAPNSGDANGDGVMDSDQTEVTSIVNTVSGGYTTVDATGSTNACDVTTFQVNSETSLATQDPNANYPVGLNNFTIHCPNPGDTAKIKIIYSQAYDTSDWVYKKYNPTTHVYTDMTNAVTFGTQTINGMAVTTVTYSVTDGGQYDQDGTANGIIVDPAGPAIVGLANTGSPIIFYTVSAGGLMAAALVVFCWPNRTRYRLASRR